MRIFWAAIGLLLIATAAVIVIGADGSDERAPASKGASATMTPETPETQPTPTPQREDEEITTEVRAFNLPIDQVRRHFEANDARDEPTTPPVEQEALAEASESKAAALDADQQSVPTPAPEAKQVAAATRQDILDEIVTSIMDEQDDEQGADDAPSERPGPNADAAAAPDGAMTIEDRTDGARTLDGRFVIAGAGTPDDPYIVNWSLLSSAAETFDPRLGKTELPERIKMLHDAHVRITGFVAFPFMVQESRELLMMQNQWDGCCLGVPPTAYDAIEVTLKDPANRLQRMLDYGAVEGRLKVEPYVRGNWLISLYMMEDAALAPEM